MSFSSLYILTVVCSSLWNLAARLFPTLLSHLSKWDMTPITFGNPWDMSKFRNSKVSISKLCSAFTINSTRSATFATSVIAFMSLGTSKNVMRWPRFAMTVTGPRTSTIVCFAKWRTRHFISKDLPQPGGPCTATRRGGS